MNKTGKQMTRAGGYILRLLIALPLLCSVVFATFVSAPAALLAQLLHRDTSGKQRSPAEE